MYTSSRQGVLFSGRREKFTHSLPPHKQFTMVGMHAVMSWPFYCASTTAAYQRLP